MRWDLVRGIFVAGKNVIFVLAMRFTLTQPVTKDNVFNLYITVPGCRSFNLVDGTRGFRRNMGRLNALIVAK